MVGKFSQKFLLSNCYHNAKNTPLISQRGILILSVFIVLLDDDGKREAVKRVDELTEIPRYTKTDDPPQD